MIKYNLKDAIAHAKQMYPVESTGFFYIKKGKLKYEPVANISDAPDSFVVAPSERLRVQDMGELVAFVHSHPDGQALPSVADQYSHTVCGLDWVIVALNGDDVQTHIMPAHSEELPLFGRTFVHGVTDCYTFIKDWYRQELGIGLPDFVRADEWWAKGQNLYLDNFASAGFIEVSDPQHGDVLLMNIGANVPNHGAIYTGDTIEHHLYSRLSGRDVYGLFYRDRTTHVLRHDTQFA